MGHEPGTGHALFDEGRLEDYIAYHGAMVEVGDMDPAYPILLYVASRYELNMEQRYWLAFLYAACYCVPTAFYILSEFPDAENVDVGRLERWWTANRERVVFQTDRRWIRSRNQFVDHFISYRDHIGDMSQEERFATFLADTPEETYKQAYKYMLNVYQLGRYSMFLYLEAVHAMTAFPMMPDGLDLRNSQSSRNGLCFAMNRDEWLRGHDYGKGPLDAEAYTTLSIDFNRLLEMMAPLQPADASNVWSVETSLCAYKKIHRGKRYVGYYIDRQYDEIAKMQGNVPDGVDWQPLWDFRQVHFEQPWLREFREVTGIDPKVIRPQDPDHWYQRPAKYFKHFPGGKPLVSVNGGQIVVTGM
jgi:hypothetical protein